MFDKNGLISYLLFCLYFFGVVLKTFIYCVIIYMHVVYR